MALAEDLRSPHLFELFEGGEDQHIVVGGSFFDEKRFEHEAADAGHTTERLVPLARLFPLGQDVVIEPVGERGILDSGIPLGDVA